MSNQPRAIPTSWVEECQKLSLKLRNERDDTFREILLGNEVDSEGYSLMSKWGCINDHIEKLNYMLKVTLRG